MNMHSFFENGTQQMDVQGVQHLHEYASGGIDNVTTLPDLSDYETVDEVRYAMAVHYVKAYIEGGGDTLDGTLQAIYENLEGLRSPKEPMVLITARITGVAVLQDVIDAMLMTEIEPDDVGIYEVVLGALLDESAPPAIDVVRHLAEGGRYNIVPPTNPYRF